MDKPTSYTSKEIGAMDFDKSLSASQVARMLGVTRERVGQMARAGKITATMTPIGRLYAEDEVNRVLAERKVKGRGVHVRVG